MQQPVVLRHSSWIVLIALPALVLMVPPATWPAWALMWSLAVAIYAGCKWLSWAAADHTNASIGWHLAYLFGWPGLDAFAFLEQRPLPKTRTPTPREWLLASTRLLCGAALFWLVPRVVPGDWKLLIGWAGMVGLMMMLHFGALHLLSCAWRWCGVHARPLMEQPLRSQSLSEFWGRRWNTAFRDLTHRFLFRPLTKRLGGTWAVLIGFLFSGLVHDLVISLPAGAGYGGPTLFFLLQGGAMVFERADYGRQIGLGRGAVGRLYTFGVLVLPLGVLLFHPPFVRCIIVPFMAALGALCP